MKKLILLALSLSFIAFTSCTKKCEVVDLEVDGVVVLEGEFCIDTDEQATKDDEDFTSEYKLGCSFSPDNCVDVDTFEDDCKAFGGTVSSGSCL